MNKQFIFSVIMPIYNVETYLEEAILSVINQSLGFEDNIQLILVNDGSPDNCDEICKKYASKYPSNVVYIEKENGGVSSARNAGLEFAKGKYVNFLDSDDIWDENAFKTVNEFIINNPGIKILTARLILFGRENLKPHHLDYKYKKTTIIDIDNVYDYPELSVAKSFISLGLLYNTFFDETVSVSEDVLLLSKLILQEKRYAVISVAKYYYRKREELESALDTKVLNKSWYLVTPKLVFLGLIYYSIERFGTVHPYIQYLLITDLQWRLKRTDTQILSQAECVEYKDILKSVLSYIDDKYIMKQRHMKFWYKMYALKIKYGDSLGSVDDDVRTTIGKKLRMRIDILEGDGELRIYGRADEKYIDESVSIQVHDTLGNVYKMHYYIYPVYDREGLYEHANMTGYMHFVSLPFKPGVGYYFCASGIGSDGIRLKFSFGKFSRLNNLENSFCRLGKHILKTDKTYIRIYKYKLKTFFMSNHRFQKSLIENGVEQDLIDTRRYALKLKLLRRNPICLIYCDGGLNKDYSFDLSNKLQLESGTRLDKYYVVNELGEMDSTLRGKKNVLTYGSKKHLLYQLASAVVVSSKPDEWILNPFKANKKYYEDLMEYKFVYVPDVSHGIDEPKVIHRASKNIKLLVANNRRERDAYLAEQYGYTAEEVVERLGLEQSLY